MIEHAKVWPVLMTLKLNSREIMNKGLALSALIVLLAACSAAQTTGTVGQPVLATEQQLNCPFPAGVTLSADQERLIIALGQRSSAGFGIELTRQDVASGDLLIAYEEKRPQGMAAQMMTSPCMYLSLPEDWQTLVVENGQTGERAQFVHR